MEQKELVNKLRDFSEQGLAIAPICTAAGVNKMRFYGAVNYGKSKAYSKDIKWTGEECKLISDAINTESLVRHRGARGELEIATVDRIKTAIGNGVTAAHLSRETGIGVFKLASIANYGESESYKRLSRLSDIECKKINAALDNIKGRLCGDMEVTTVDRIKAAISNGVTVAHLSRETGISNFRLASIISRLSDDECKKINAALDSIKDKL